MLQDLSPAYEQDDKLANEIFAFLIDSGTLLSLQAKWFQDEPLANWKSASPVHQLNLIAGKADSSSLSIEQLADLLRFSDTNLRMLASVRLKEELGDRLSEPELGFLMSNRSEFSRYQIISYMLMLTSPEQGRLKVLDAFLQTEPPLDSLGMLLSFRDVPAELDEVSVQLARYLNTENWKIPDGKEIRKRLIEHHEPLVRALVYSQLSVLNEEDFQLLQKAAQSESVPSLSKLLAGKLRLAELNE